MAITATIIAMLLSALALPAAEWMNISDAVNRVGPNYAWDAKANIFYASRMTKPVFKYQR